MAQTQTQASLPQQKLMDSPATPVPQPVTHKSATTPAVPSQGEGASSPLFDSLASSGNTFVPPGVSTLSSLNSLALTLALRLAPVTVAHAAPSAFQVTSLHQHQQQHQQAPSSAPFLSSSSFESSAQSQSQSQSHGHNQEGGLLLLDPKQQFPLNVPLHIPFFGSSSGRAKKGLVPVYVPSYGQLLDLEEKEEVEPKWWHHTLSGIIGGVCCVYAGQPFDTVKVRLQTQSKHSPLYSGPLDCLRKTVSQGGYRALYKGASPALASVVTENAVLFTAHSTVKDFFKSFNADPSADLSLGQEALAGGVAGFFSSTAITPAEVIKCRLQIQDRLTSSGVSNSPLRYSGPLDAVVRIARTEGLRGLFAGLPSVWMRDIPFNFVFLGSYEAFCTLATWQSSKARDQLGAGELFLCGGLAGVSGWSIVFPMDVIKSKMQTVSTNIGAPSALQVLKHTIRTEGVRALYQGWSAAVLRAFPANAALLMGVEVSKRFFGKLD